MKIKKDDLKVTKADPSRVVADADEKLDLGAAAKKIKGADTPHKGQFAPGISVVLYCDLADKAAADKAAAAAGKIKGVDAKGTKADATKDEISIAISGDEKLTVAALVDALKQAGVSCKTTK